MQIVVVLNLSQTPEGTETRHTITSTRAWRDDDFKMPSRVDLADGSIEITVPDRYAPYITEFVRGATHIQVRHITDILRESLMGLEGVS